MNDPPYLEDQPSYSSGTTFNKYSMRVKESSNWRYTRVTKRIEEMKIWITIESFMSFIAMDLLFLITTL